MPEGDTVFLAAERMRTALGGTALTRSEFRVPQLATVSLVGRVVLDVVPRGKHLLTRFDGDLTLHTHFRMEGSWRLFRNGTRWRGGPAHQIRLVLANSGWTAVGLRIPVIELIRTCDEHTVVGHLGPDVLGPDWDLERAVANVAADPLREVGTALLDQRNLAGLGNLYRTEALYLRGVNPWAQVGEVTDLPRLVELARQLIAANARRWEQTTTGALARGESHHVFERGGRPCRRCGTAIRTADQGDPGYARITYWCPRCQPGPSPRGSARRAAPATRPRYRN